MLDYNDCHSAGSFQPRYLNEALLLMAKVHYVQGRYRDAQGMCARVGLEELTREDQPTYHLRLLAEAFVIKGRQTRQIKPRTRSDRWVVLQPSGELECKGW